MSKLTQNEAKNQNKNLHPTAIPIPATNATAITHLTSQPPSPPSAAPSSPRSSPTLHAISAPQSPSTSTPAYTQTLSSTHPKTPSPSRPSSSPPPARVCDSLIAFNSSSFSVSSGPAHTLFGGGKSQFCNIEFESMLVLFPGEEEKSTPRRMRSLSSKYGLMGVIFLFGEEWIDGVRVWGWDLNRVRF
ncbi:hypothetical protein AKJ16_DCAP03674 [Drosera capensis]